MNTMIKRIVQILLSLAFLLTLSWCKSPEKRNNSNMNNPKPRNTYADDVNFLKKNNIEIIELKNPGSSARVMVIPAYQGRIMTSSSDSRNGLSYGWINHKFIEAGQTDDQFNPVGGEERLWLGPEGGPFSIYFKEGDEQVYANWHVPKVLDTESFEIIDQNSESVLFSKKFKLNNASGTYIQGSLERQVNILQNGKVEELLDIKLPQRISWVAYETQNILKNMGDEAWTKESGALSIWLLSMFNTSEKSVVFIPYKEYREENPGNVVNDEYFGKVPADRLKLKDGVIFFKTDGKKRSKIGIPPERVLPLCGSYDAENKVLTLLWHSSKGGDAEYVNSKWGPQVDPFSGDVVNSYNDGPLEDGSIMGPFYEIESSSPAAFLKPGEKIKHIQRIYHFEGGEEDLNVITQSLFGLTIDQISSAFGE